MEQVDDFSAYHDELLDGHYDCVDRIVLNGYFPLGQQGGGFRTWWRALTGSDQTLDQEHLQRLAGRFSRRLHAWAKQQGIPLIHCAPGERKHELAESYLPQDPKQGGLFLILVAKAPGLVGRSSTAPMVFPTCSARRLGRLSITTTSISSIPIGRISRTR